MPFDLRPSSLFFVAFGSAIAGLLFGSEMVRWIMAGALALVAVPLYRAIGHAVFDERLDDAELAFVAEKRRRALQGSHTAADQHATRE